MEIDGETEEDGGEVNDPDADDESCLPVALVEKQGGVRGAERRRDAGFGLMPAQRRVSKLLPLNYVRPGSVNPFINRKNPLPVSHIFFVVFGRRPLKGF